MTEQARVEMGQRIRDKRDLLKITQEKAAEILDISLTHYKNIERGRTSVSLDLLMVICERFELDPTFLLTGKEIGINPIIEFYEKLPQEKRRWFDRSLYYLNMVLKK